MKLKTTNSYTRAFEAVRRVIAPVGKIFPTGFSVFKSANKGQSPNPRLVTPIGKLLDKVPYWSIVGSIVFVISLCAWYFQAVHSNGQVVKDGPLNWRDAFYFSVVTFSSLGYGEITPIDSGKTVAALEVLFGLISIAILVGKLASERQAALLLLNYTSEQQRRLTKFRFGIKGFRKRIRKHFADYNHSMLDKQIRDNFKLISVVKNHLVTHANEGRITYSGNAPGLRKIYKSVIKTQILLYEILRTAHVEQRTITYANKTLIAINTISLSMRKFHKKDEKVIGRFNEIQKTERNIQNWRLLKAAGKAQFKNRIRPTKYLLNRVYENLPLLPWEKDIEKKVALTLNVENKMIKRCVDILIAEGRWPGLDK